MGSSLADKDSTICRENKREEEEMDRGKGNTTQKLWLRESLTHPLLKIVMMWAYSNDEYTTKCMNIGLPGSVWGPHDWET